MGPFLLVLGVLLAVATEMQAGEDTWAYVVQAQTEDPSPPIRGIGLPRSGDLMSQDGGFRAPVVIMARPEPLAGEGLIHERLKVDARLGVSSLHWRSTRRANSGRYFRPWAERRPPRFRPRIRKQIGSRTLVNPCEPADSLDS